MAAAVVVVSIMFPLLSSCTSVKKDCEGIFVGTTCDCIRVATIPLPMRLPSLGSFDFLSTSYYNSPTACFTDKID